MNKASDNDWFKISPNKDGIPGTKWQGTCWYIHELVKYEFTLQFEVKFNFLISNFHLDTCNLPANTY